MNIIFLDIDGVLNSQNYLLKNHQKQIELFKKYKFYSEKYLAFLDLIYEIDFEKLDMLKEIIDKTSSKVVVTSSITRREIYPYFKEFLINIGIPIIEEIKDCNRGKGITKYLKEYNISNYIILDDEIFHDYNEDLLSHLVKTNFYKDGLTKEHKIIAIEMLHLNKYTNIIL